MSQDRAYLQFFYSAREIDSFYELETTEILILNLISAIYLENKRLNVSALIAHKEIASPASIHGALKKLIKKKLVNLSYDEDDERVKYPVPTEKALERLKKMNKLF